MMLVTLQQAKDHLRVDDDLQDIQIAEIAEDASDAVILYLSSTRADAIDAFMDSNGEPITELLPGVVRRATLMTIGYFFRYRDENEGEAYDRGYLPKPVTALLYPLRDPGYA